MNEAVVSGSFAIIGTALGWVLSEVGAGWRDLVQRRRTEQADATARVLDTARAAVAVGEGIRWLIQVDVAKKLIGEGSARRSTPSKPLIWQTRSSRRAFFCRPSLQEGRVQPCSRYLSS
jgi:hypothetical protein